MPPIIWHCAAFTPDGYGDEARAFLRSLEQAGEKPGLSDHSDWTSKRAILPASEQKQLEHQQKRYQQLRAPGEALHVHHYVPGRALHALAPEGAINVSRSMFETDRVPASWLPYLALMDEIWVPTGFAVESFANSGIPEEKMRVLGETIDFELFDPARGVEPLDIPGVPEDSLVFMANFDFSERKGWRQLLQAWQMAFDPDDPVCLVLKTSTFSFSAEHIRQRISSFWGVGRKAAPVVVYSELLDADQMPSLYASADAFVLPSRGEGWGRPYMEAMAMGLPTVGSNWSGQLDFMKPEYCWLVDGGLVDVPSDAELGNNLYRGHKWFEADAESLSLILQEIADDILGATVKASKARQGMLDEFSPQLLAKRTVDLADDIWARRQAMLSKPVGALWVKEGQPQPGTPALALGVQSAMEKEAGAVYRINQRVDYPETDHLLGVLVDYQPQKSKAPLLGLLDNGQSPALDLAKACTKLSLIATSGGQRFAELLKAGVPEALMMELGDVPWDVGFKADSTSAGKQLAAGLFELGEQGIEPIRSFSKASLESLANTTLWQPDFEGPFIEAFFFFCQSLGFREDCTLAIWSDQEPDLVQSGLTKLEEEIGRLDFSPDILLLEENRERLTSAALACDQILAGPGCLLPLEARHLPLVSPSGPYKPF